MADSNEGVRFETPIRRGQQEGYCTLIYVSAQVTSKHCARLKERLEKEFSGVEEVTGNGGGNGLCLRTTGNFKWSGDSDYTKMAGIIAEVFNYNKTPCVTHP